MAVTTVLSNVAEAASAVDLVRASRLVGGGERPNGRFACGAQNTVALRVSPSLRRKFRRASLRVGVLLQAASILTLRVSK